MSFHVCNFILFCALSSLIPCCNYVSWIDPQERITVSRSIIYYTTNVTPGGARAGPWLLWVFVPTHRPKLILTGHRNVLITQYDTWSLINHRNYLCPMYCSFLSVSFRHSESISVYPPREKKTLGFRNRKCKRR